MSWGERIGKLWKIALWGSGRSVVFRDAAGSMKWVLGRLVGSFVGMIMCAAYLLAQVDILGAVLCLVVAWASYASVRDLLQVIS